MRAMSSAARIGRRAWSVRHLDDLSVAQRHVADAQAGDGPEPHVRGQGDLHRRPDVDQSGGPVQVGRSPPAEHRTRRDQQACTADADAEGVRQVGVRVDAAVETAPGAAAELGGGEQLRADDVPLAEDATAEGIGATGRRHPLSVP